MTKETGKVRVVIMTGEDADNLQALYAAIDNLCGTYSNSGQGTKMDRLIEAFRQAPQVIEGRPRIPLSEIERFVIRRTFFQRFWKKHKKEIVDKVIRKFK